MPDERVVRPSTKLVVASYIGTLLFLGAAAFIAYGYFQKEFSPWHLICMLLLYFPLKSHIATRMLSMTVDQDHLTYESGLLSATRRTVDLAKVQDVTAKQTFGQRLLGTGDLMVETAGER